MGEENAVEGKTNTWKSQLMWRSLQEWRREADRMQRQGVVESPATPLESFVRAATDVRWRLASRISWPRPLPEEDHMRRRSNGLHRSQLTGTIRVLSVIGVLSNWTASPAKSQVSASVVSGLPYRHIGPVGNRVSAVTGVPGDPNTYYFGARGA
jgi:hypothetical protein